MPIAVTRNDDLRCVTVKISDPWSVEEVAVAADRQVSQQAWRYGTLLDLRGSVWVPSEPDLMWLVTRGQQQHALNGARGPVAVVFDRDTSTSLVQHCLQYGSVSSGEPARAFDDGAAAVEWLAAHPVAG